MRAIVFKNCIIVFNGDGSVKRLVSENLITDINITLEQPTDNIAERLLGKCRLIELANGIYESLYFDVPLVLDHSIYNILSLYFNIDLLTTHYSKNRINRRFNFKLTQSIDIEAVVKEIMWEVFKHASIHI